MHTSTLLSAMARRLVETGIISMDNDFVGVNMPTADINDKDFFILESEAGHSAVPWTTARKAPADVTVSYTLTVPAGTGTRLLDEKTRLIEAFFDPMGDNAVIRCPDSIAEVKRIEVKGTYATDAWCYRNMFIYLRVSVFADTPF